MTDERIELLLGDCVEGMREMASDSVDIVVTSPPYNLGIDYSTYDDRGDREAYLAWSREWMGEVRRVLKPDGSFFLNVGAAPSNPYLPHELALLSRDQFVLQNTIHWIKSITVHRRDGTEVSVGHFKPINSRRYVNDCHEFVFHLTADGRVPLDRTAVGVAYQDKSNIGRWRHTGGRDLRCRGNVWFIPYETIRRRSDERPHPATFPTRLAEWCLRLHGRGEETVMLDPFLGIGHSAVAAYRARVARFIGFEIDPGYLETARGRIAGERDCLL